MNMVKRTWAEISLNAIEHNYNVIRNKVADDTKVCCVIKADGYGHGAVELSQVYEKLGADFFAVSNIDEGIEIRKSGSKLPIVILGYTPVSEAENLAEYDISQAVFSLEYAKELSEKCVEEDCICKMHIKVDSGMSRIGFMCQEFPRDEYSIEEICEACCLPNLEVEGLFTHFCVSDEDAEGREFTNKQYENFIHVRDSLKKRGVDISVVHCSNSGAIEDYPETCCDMVRAGIILYGLAPSSKLADRLDLVPAMTLKTVVAFVKEVQKGATISYGRTFTADRKMKIATVPIGYADGFIRQNAKDIVFSSPFPPFLMTLWMMSSRSSKGLTARGSRYPCWLRRTLTSGGTWPRTGARAIGCWSRPRITPCCSTALTRQYRGAAPSLPPSANTKLVCA